MNGTTIEKMKVIQGELEGLKTRKANIEREIVNKEEELAGYMDWANTRNLLHDQCAFTFGSLKDAMVQDLKYQRQMKRKGI